MFSLILNAPRTLVMGGASLGGIMGVGASVGLLKIVESVVYDLEERDDIDKWQVNASLIVGIAMSLFVGIVSACLIGTIVGLATIRFTANPVAGNIVGVVITVMLVAGLIFNLVTRLRRD